MLDAEIYQRLRSAVERVSVVSAELGVCAAERAVAVGFWALDAVVLVSLASRAFASAKDNSATSSADGS